MILANTQLSTCLFVLDRPLRISFKIKEKGAKPLGLDTTSVDLTGRGGSVRQSGTLAAVLIPTPHHTTSDIVF